jgi:hypothetical protein
MRYCHAKHVVSVNEKTFLCRHRRCGRIESGIVWGLFCFKHLLQQYLARIYRQLVWTDDGDKFDVLRSKHEIYDHEISMCAWAVSLCLKAVARKSTWDENPRFGLYSSSLHDRSGEPILESLPSRWRNVFLPSRACFTQHSVHSLCN